MCFMLCCQVMKSVKTWRVVRHHGWSVTTYHLKKNVYIEPTLILWGVWVDFYCKFCRKGVRSTSLLNDSAILVHQKCFLNKRTLRVNSCFLLLLLPLSLPVLFSTHWVLSFLIWLLSSFVLTCSSFVVLHPIFSFLCLSVTPQIHHVSEKNSRDYCGIMHGWVLMII